MMKQPGVEKMKHPSGIRGEMEVRTSCLTVTAFPETFANLVFLQEAEGLSFLS